MFRLADLTRRIPCWLTVFTLCFPLSALAQPSLWLAQKDQQQLYLFGSIHIGSPRLYPLPSSVLDAFKQSEQLWVEVDTRHLSSEDMQQIRRDVTLPEGETIDAHISVQTLKKLKKRSQQLGLSYSVLEHYQPWYISVLITQKVYQQQGYNSQLGVDQYFLKQATLKDKPIRQLETAPQQFQSLSSLKSDSNTMLKQVLIAGHTLTQSLSQTVDAWRSGDQVKLRQLLSEQESESDKQVEQKFKQNLLIKRNQNWLQILTSIKSHQPQFIVVGALHLSGPEGLLNLLKGSGYHISQIK
ncbi:TraB/GumN family protein [Celerinatantimonas sp. YJH-8]|uniref:TraB/GumN family protein n=1 Tax=Celerinatantimonas sp. YJH-8 TaxID=3228714 RepID=UPI0038BEC897